MSYYCSRSPLRKRNNTPISSAPTASAAGPATRSLYIGSAASSSFDDNVWRSCRCQYDCFTPQLLKSVDVVLNCPAVQGHPGHPPQGLQGPGVPRLPPHCLCCCPLLQRALVHPPPHLSQVWTHDNPALESMGHGLLLLILVNLLIIIKVDL